MDELNKNGLHIKKGAKITFRDQTELECEMVTVTPGGIYYIESLSMKEMIFIPHSSIAFITFYLEEKASGKPPIIPNDTPPQGGPLPGMG